MLNFFGFRLWHFALIFIVLALRTSFFDFYDIPTTTMEPNYSPRKTVYVNKLQYNFSIPFTNIVLFKTKSPKRGDVVIYKEEDRFVKYTGRIIGLPKDRVSINSDGWPIVNDKELNIRFLETKILDAQEAHIYEFQLDDNFSYKVARLVNSSIKPMRNESIVIKENEYFIMGDNFDFTVDSRMNGPVGHKFLVGKVISK
jgi:signal peptidase I